MARLGGLRALSTRTDFVRINAGFDAGRYPAYLALVHPLADVIASKPATEGQAPYHIRNLGRQSPPSMSSHKEY